jgi:crossover junction endodeoxyribonuclease RuvC
LKILGIDPGYGRLGWAVVEQQGSALRAVGYGCHETPAEQPFEQRLLSVHQFVAGLMQEHAPQQVAVEQLYFAKNAKTAMQVAQARGAILVAITASGTPLCELQPVHVKQALAGTGAATKAQVQAMVQRLLGLPAPPKPDDAADALALAILALRTAPLRVLQEKAQSLARPLKLAASIRKGKKL